MVLTEILIKIHLILRSPQSFQNTFRGKNFPLERTRIEVVDSITLERERYGPNPF